MHNNEKMNKTACFTGPRASKLYGYDKTPYIPLVEHITNKLEHFYNQGYRRFISGGAQGVDQLAFWAVNKLKKSHADVQNIVYVPFVGQERNWRKTGLFGQDEYQLMLKLADEVIYLQDKLTEKNAIVKALFDRNHKMVEAADIVIALYPDDVDYYTASGGTAECMRYADKKYKPIYKIDYTNIS